MSKELKLLIESINVAFCGKSPEVFKSFFEEKLDFKKLQKLLKYHGIIPIFYDQIYKNNIENLDPKFLNFLNSRSINNAIYGMAQMKETQKLILELSKENILGVPYKGAFFLKELYDLNYLRESTDIDILIKPDDCFKAQKVFLKNGYSFDDDRFNSFEEGIENSDAQEFGFSKGKFLLDFHREFNYELLPYKLDYLSYFENLNPKIFFDEKVPQPNLSQLFSMVILHNGGKCLWLRLKYVVDLLMFFKKFGEDFNWEAELKIQQKNKTENVTLLGYLILKKYFKIDPIPALENKKINEKIIFQITEYWDNAEHYSKLIPRIKYEKILIKSQDKGFDLKKYLINFYKYQSFGKIKNDSKENTNKWNLGIISFVKKFYNYLNK